MTNKNLNSAFDPEMSEYNPILEEIETLKKTQREDESFISNLIKKLTSTVMVRLD